MPGSTYRRTLPLRKECGLQNLLCRVVKNVNALTVLSPLEQELRRLIIVYCGQEPPVRILPSLPRQNPTSTF